MNRLPRTVAVGLVVASGVGVYEGVQIKQSGNTIEWQSFKDTNGNLQVPYGITVTDDSKLDEIGKLILYGPGYTYESAKKSHSDNRPNAKPHYASQKAVQAALGIIQTNGAVRCPEDAQYQAKLDKGDPSSTICLDIATAKQSSNGEVVFYPILNPNYKRLLDLSGMLVDPKNAAGCKAVASTMQQYGEALLNSSGQIPFGTVAPVAISANPSLTSSCDLHPLTKTNTNALDTP